MGIECSDCSVNRADADRHATWVFSSPPKVYRIDPDGPAGRAGLRDGDTLHSIDGRPRTEPEGGRRFGAVAPGQTVAFLVGRDGERRELRVTAVGPSTPAPRGRPARPGRAPRREPPRLPGPGRRGPWRRRPPRCPPQRWTGTVGDVDVEVRGAGSVVVEVRRSGREVEIVTPDGTVVLRERTDR